MFPSIKRIKLQGMGEPFLNNEIFKMADYAKKKGSYVYTYTNGSLFSQKNVADKIMDSGFDLVRVSINAGTKKEYEMIHKNGCFRNFINGLDRLQGKENKPDIEFWVVLMKINIEELNKIILLAKQFNINIVNLQIIPNTFIYKESVQNKISSMVTLSNKNIIDAVRKTEMVSKAQGVKLRVQLSKIKSDSNKCHWPFDKVFIAANGDVIPCCSIADSNVLRMGNVFENHITDIWNSEIYELFRERIITNNVLDCCAQCYLKDNINLQRELEKYLNG